LPVRPDNYTLARISPDGTKIALVIGSALPPTDPPPEIYVLDLKTENLTQLTFNPQTTDGPVWSRDSSRIYYRGFASSGVAVYTLPVDGGTPQLVGHSDPDAFVLPWSFSPDGKTLFVHEARPSGMGLGTLEVGQSDKVMPLLDRAEQPSMSPNGGWLLLQPGGDGTTGLQVDIRPYPEVTQQRRRIGAGIDPVFSPDGSEVFVFDGGGLSAASVQYSPFSVGSLHQLFRGKYWYGIAGPGGELGRAWDVDPKNDRFLMITLPQGGAGENAEAPAQISVVLNWFEEVRRRMPKH